MANLNVKSFLLVILSTGVLKADCDSINKRHFQLTSLPSSDVEVGYVWDFKGAVAICGGCGFVNAPGSPPQPTNPFTVNMEWGDGVVEPLTVQVGGATAASHRYIQTSVPGKPFTPAATAKAYCVAGWGQFWEYVSSNGGFWSQSPVGQAVGADYANPISINVYPASQPTSIIIDNPIRVGQNIKEALTLILQRAAPPSGTVLNLSSSNPKVLLEVPSGPKGQNIVFVMPPNNFSAVFDLDTHGANPGTSVTFTVANVALGGTTKTKGPVPLIP